jgi:hypothetical protein
MPHRRETQAFGKEEQALVRAREAHRPGRDRMINWNEFGEWGTAFLVVITGALAGHYAAAGMTAIQWAGALCAVLGSVTLAVGVRVWPAAQKIKTRRIRD